MIAQRIGSVSLHLVPRDLQSSVGQILASTVSVPFDYLRAWCDLLVWALAVVPRLSFMNAYLNGLPENFSSWLEG